MGIYPGKKKVVVASFNNFSSDHWTASGNWREFCVSTIYLHHFLAMKVAREKETIITIMVGCIVLSKVFSIPVLLLVTLGIGIAGIASDKLTRWIHKAWFLLADILGYVMSKIILGTLFIFVLIPIALLAKIFRKDIMMVKKDYPSYFVEKHTVYEPKDLENPW
jgi:hypothetical protein